MITKFELIKMMRTLEKVYSKPFGFYTRIEVDILYNKIQKISPSDLVKLNERLVSRCKFAPKVSEFLEEAHNDLENIRKSGISSLNHRSVPEVCQRCYGTGSLSAKRIEKPYQQGYAFVCGCSASDNKLFTMQIPRWDDSFTQLFWIQNYHEVPKDPVNQHLYNNGPRPQEPESPKVNVIVEKGSIFVYNDANKPNDNL